MKLKKVVITLALSYICILIYTAVQHRMFNGGNLNVNNDVSWMNIAKELVSKKGIEKDNFVAVHEREDTQDIFGNKVNIFVSIIFI